MKMYRRLRNFIKKYIIRNTLLKVKAVGLRKAIQVEKKRRKRNKSLFYNLRDLNNSKTIFRSPIKI